MRTRNNILKLLLAIICVLSFTMPSIHSQVDAATKKVVKKKTKQLPPSQRYNYKKPGAKEKRNYQNCTDLRKVFPNGVTYGHRAYLPKFDRDKDKIACERY
ncbi:excalibur calcium-binding domain-containing protein [Mammaliicoccus sciuri]|uniref:excalibur calcium-binding domain-containing protein n=1 Tax=Mammaliicoccus sciuri TaxID=1296 RepID=UPI001A991D7E|nr:excalibur calcium-binding domain-containing protein [Mammaliicoccus sciuri]MBO1219281.1 excalibur calcium-binding domain-containing protein [Mammaliicoccus sciuri]MBO1231898.1 excalibur calcium-binding domain-containing protein [Mammaliicoccus sciuri]